MTAPRRHVCASARIVAAIVTAAALPNLLVPTHSAQAQTRTGIPAAARAPVADAVAEAVRRFGVPARWLYGVIAAESGGDPQAISSAGAMGLMQLMPATWAAERARLQLGTNPFDPRDNILAGADYLRAMYAHYGAIGMLAAYNAGPRRYEAYRNAGRALPGETIAYVRRLAPTVSDERSTDSPAFALDAPRRPAAAMLFADASAASRPGNQTVDAAPRAAAIGPQSAAMPSRPTPATGSRSTLYPHGDSLFVALGRPTS